MKLSRTYITSIDKYINYLGRGGLFNVDGMAIACNDISLIIFTLDGDSEHIEPSDFDGIEVKEYPNFKESIWKYVVKPYWDDRTVAYKPMPITLYLDDIKADVTDVHKEYEIPTRTKLYDGVVTNGRFKTDVALKYGGDDGIWLNPELLYDVAKLITSKNKPVDIWIPFNRKLPAVVVGENKYGKHLGFVLGTMKNYKED
jgi:hypothetical protein